MQNMCKTKMQNMLYMQNMQNKMYKICNRYADKYPEYVHKYVKNAEYAEYAISFSDKQNMCKTKICKTSCICKICKNMQINMLNMYINV